MHYEKPTLHILSPSKSTQGNCANGTGALKGDFICASGGSPTAFRCDSGGGARNYCYSGAAAGTSGTGINYCNTGTGTSTGCGTGSAPNI